MCVEFRSTTRACLALRTNLRTYRTTRRFDALAHDWAKREYRGGGGHVNEFRLDSNKRVLAKQMTARQLFSTNCSWESWLPTDRIRSSDRIGERRLRAWHFGDESLSGCCTHCTSSGFQCSCCC